MSRRKVKELIPKEAYRALECIVGSRYVTANPAECQAYTGRGYSFEFFWWHDISRRPAGVILPETTEQVARIIKVCNHYGIPYLPGSTFGWVPLSSSNLRDDFLVIDMKRMNELVIDEKNMYALVGPGVTYAHLQAEAMKKDLYTMVPAGGGGVGVLANHLTCGWGSLCYRITMSAPRRMNGVEWVTPEGEIVRLGSLVNGDDSGYWRGGLGPGLLGILKGQSSWTGSMGVVTKMALKLYPFQPVRLEPEGIGCNTSVKLPSRTRWYNITFPSEEALWKAIREIARAQIAAYVNRVPSYMRELSRCRGDSEFRNMFWQSWRKLTPKAVADVHILRVLLIGYTSQKQFEYEERVLTDIVNENGGTPLRTRQSDEACFLYACAPDIWMATGSQLLITTGLESLRCTVKMGEEFQKRWTRDYKADALDQYGEWPWYMPVELGRIAYSECDGYYDTRRLDHDCPELDRELLKRSQQFFQSVMPAIEAKTGWVSNFTSHTRCSYTSDATQHNTPVWVERFQKEFNPKGLSNTGFPYIGDKLSPIFPDMITDEIREAVKGVKEGRWRGL
jgi:hypothetical protein